MNAKLEPSQIQCVVLISGMVLQINEWLYFGRAASLQGEVWGRGGVKQPLLKMTGPDKRQLPFRFPRCLLHIIQRCFGVKSPIRISIIVWGLFTRLFGAAVELLRRLNMLRSSDVGGTDPAEANRPTLICSLLLFLAFHSLSCGFFFLYLGILCLIIHSMDSWLVAREAEWVVQ